MFTGLPVNTRQSMRVWLAPDNSDHASPNHSHAIAVPQMIRSLSDFVPASEFSPTFITLDSRLFAEHVFLKMLPNCRRNRALRRRVATFSTVPCNIKHASFCPTYQRANRVSTVYLLAGIGVALRRWPTVKRVFKTATLRRNSHRRDIFSSHRCPSVVNTGRINSASVMSRVNQHR